MKKLLSILCLIAILFACKKPASDRPSKDSKSAKVSKSVSMKLMFTQDEYIQKGIYYIHYHVYNKNGMFVTRYVQDILEGDTATQVFDLPKGVYDVVAVGLTSEQPLFSVSLFKDIFFISSGQIYLDIIKVNVVDSPVTKEVDLEEITAGVTFKIQIPDSISRVEVTYEKLYTLLCRFVPYEQRKDGGKLVYKVTNRQLPTHIFGYHTALVDSLTNAVLTGYNLTGKKVLETKFIMPLPKGSQTTISGNPFNGSELSVVTE